MQTLTYCIFGNTIVYLLNGYLFSLQYAAGTILPYLDGLLIAQKCRFSQVIVHLLDDMSCIQKYSRYARIYNVLYITPV